MKKQTPDESYTQAALALSPQGHVYLERGVDAQETLPDEIVEQLTHVFELDTNVGLLLLGIKNFSTPLPPSFSFWQQYARLFMTEVCKLYNLPEILVTPIVPVPSQDQREELVHQAPCMKGLEYLNADLLEGIWNILSDALISELKSYGNNLDAYLSQHNSSLNHIGRICFHLAENKNNEQYPFAFLATYISKVSYEAKLQHTPLNKALQEYVEEKNSVGLLKLLLPLQKAAQQSVFIKDLVDQNKIYQTLLWTARQAHQFLKEVSLFESCGIMVRIPNWWNPGRPTRPQISITIGDKKNKNASLGLAALVDFDLNIALGAHDTLTEQEWQEILASKEPLVKIKGQWVEVDQEKLQSVLAYWKGIQKQIKENGLSFAEGMRLLAGISKKSEDVDNQEAIDVAAWSQVHAGTWLQEVLKKLQRPFASDDNEHAQLFKKSLHAALRPYQQIGVEWLWLLYNLGLGGCLADDMGLGKTIQVLSLLLLVKNSGTRRAPTLLVVPASLLGNWQAEVARFTPSLKVVVIHSSVFDIHTLSVEVLTSYDMVMTTYAFICRIPLLREVAWNMVILDEAQTVKNPSTKQAQAIGVLKAKVRFALTGTPIENRLSDLWSIMNFTSPGLLGSQKDFARYGKKQTFMTSIRTLVSPYILRRLKSDRSIIQDLPDKTEVQAFCNLTKQQVTLYQQAIKELEMALQNVSGIQRQGIVLSFLMRLKQICNHPDQWLGYGEYASEHSGKFIRLQEICEQIAAKQEKVLIFTQFREIMSPLATLLTSLFGHEGLMLHGDTPIKKRSEFVQAFQQEHGPQFFILSIKAGGTGLNLTNASHVIHFDRWWNPAVENQATDRAYRIGQKKNVLVHKFVCKGTIEEKIDALITSKKKLSQDILSDQHEMPLTELSNQDLIKIVSLDIHQVID